MVAFWDEWTWVAFVVAGLLMLLLELIVGVETGFDLVILGTAFIVGGAATAYFGSWYVTVTAVCVVCFLYVVLGRKYVRSRFYGGKVFKTNIDAIMGRTGIIEKNVDLNTIGQVKVGGEEWRARSKDTIPVGEEVEIMGVKGITLTVRKKIENRKWWSRWSGKKENGE